jgi:signal transduction histidine kinase
LHTVYSNRSDLSTNSHNLEWLAGDGQCADCREALATAAHELKTPLAIMAGYLQLLLGQKLGPLTPKQVDVLTEIQENGLRLSNFVQNLLAYASMKVERLEMQFEVGDMNACIREIAELWSPRFHEKAIAFYFLPAENLPAFPFDWFKVQHIVSNLLDNAMKYTPACGTVWLHVDPYFWERRAGKGKHPVDRRHRRLTAPNCCRITVADTGPGIEPQYQQEIFEEYFRMTHAGSRAEGYGLGLAIARKLVQAAGGKIWVESEPGNGSKFCFLVLLNPPRIPLRPEPQ